MDTRLKRFDKYLIIKTVSFILAILFAALGASKVVSAIYNQKKLMPSDLSSSLYYTNVLTQGNNFQLESSEMFNHEYMSYLDMAYEKGMIYKDGTKQAYEQYQDALKTRKAHEKNKLKVSILNDLIATQGEYDRSSLDSYINKGSISLKKISEHNDGHYSSFYDSDENYYGEEGEYELYGTTMPKNASESTTFNAQVVPSPSMEYSSDDYYDDYEYYNTQYNGENESAAKVNTVVPKSVIESAKDADTVIKICRTIYNGTMLDGYYAVYVSGDYLERVVEEKFNYDVYQPDYDDFKEQAEKLDESFVNYKNMRFAVKNNDSGTLISNFDGVTKDMSDKEIEKLFLAYPWSVVIDSEKGIVEQGEKYVGENLWDHFKYKWSRDWPYEDKYTIYLCFDDNFSFGDDVFSVMENNYYSIYDEFSSALRVAIVMFMLIIACVAVLVLICAKRSEDDEIHMRVHTDKIPFIIRTALNFGIIVALAAGFYGLLCILFGYQFLSVSTTRHLLNLCAAAITAFLIDWVLYVARNIKNGSFASLFVIGKIFGLIKRSAKRTHEKLKAKKEKYNGVYRDIFNDVLRKVTLFIFLPNFVFGLLALLCACNDAWIFTFLILAPLFIYDIFIVIYLFRYAFSLRKVFYALNQVRNGNYNIKIDTSSMPQSVKNYASDVEALNEGLKIAVDNATKEQRMKTELITNVSHDLKTPLTSIITYVDLLSHCDIENEAAIGYINVLGEKSERLKQLIEALVDASKASSGTMNVELIKVSLNELTRQITGEYADEFEARNLTLVEQEDESDIIVLADSKLCYRVFDNLMNNVKKYAMPGTRVYLRIYKNGGNGVISLINISEKQLNIPASELMARFVRGDESRTTEGNGLGLSIAKDFCTLQGGRLSIEINGDLFSATVEYKGISE